MLDCMDRHALASLIFETCFLCVCAPEAINTKIKFDAIVFQSLYTASTLC